MGRWLAMILLAAGAARAQGSLASQAYGVLQKNCFACHGAAKASGLDLRSRDTALAGGTRGPAVRPFNSDRSLAIQLVTRQQTPSMPPGQTLAAGDVEILRRWIDAGAL